MIVNKMTILLLAAMLEASDLRPCNSKEVANVGATVDIIISNSQNCNTKSRIQVPKMVKRIQKMSPL